MKSKNLVNKFNIVNNNKLAISLVLVAIFISYMALLTMTEYNKVLALQYEKEINNIKHQAIKVAKREETLNFKTTKNYNYIVTLRNTELSFLTKNK